MIKVSTVTAIEELKSLKRTVYDGCTTDMALDMAINSIEFLRELSIRIRELKTDLKSEDQSYYIGYMSALSAVEGILAEVKDG